MKTKAIFQKCDGPTDRPTDRPTDIAASRVAFTRLKIQTFVDWVRYTATKALSQHSYVIRQKIESEFTHLLTEYSEPENTSFMYLAKFQTT